MANTTREDRALSLSYRAAIRGDSCFYCGASGEEDDHLVRACARCNRIKKATCGTAFMLRRGDWRPLALPEAA